MSDTVRVAGIQLDIAWESPGANRARLEQHFAELPSKVNVVVLPEMFPTGFSMNPALLAEPPEGPTFRWMQQWARRLEAALVGSIITIDDGRYFNRLYWVMPDGTHHTYDKRHLFRMAGEHRAYTAGTHRLIVEWAGWRWLPVICYDLRFPVWLRNTPPYYDAMVVIANWPESRSSHWRLLLRARAVENQAYVIGVNRVGRDGNGVYHSGHSAVIDPRGETWAESAHIQHAMTAELSRHHLEAIRRHMPFLGDADDFSLGAG